jgi:CIC family chloride channel protein
MGTLFAGIIRAPMTSVFMIFELTQDYQVFVPLMIANMLSFLISKRFQPKPVYHALLEQNHIYLPDHGNRLSGNSWRARNVMNTDPQFIPESMPVREAWQTLAKNHKSTVFLVGDWNHLVGIITRKTIEQALQAGNAGEAIGSLATLDFEYLYPDQPLEAVLETCSRPPGAVPILTRNGDRRVEGIATIDTILQFIQERRS